MVIKGADTTRRQNTQSSLKVVGDSALFSCQRCRLDESQPRNAQFQVLPTMGQFSRALGQKEEEEEARGANYSSSLTFLKMAVSFFC